ncbi:hypothetical protein TNCV_1108601 [Trichonephila clavipes]|nr:hypothetical protein TNCV_1108601 [Trichonephila clavipes]
MDACKCIMPLRHEGTLNRSRAASPLVRLVAEEERWDAPDNLQDVLLQNWGGTEPKRIVTSVGLSIKYLERGRPEARDPEGCEKAQIRWT